VLSYLSILIRTRSRQAVFRGQDEDSRSNRYISTVQDRCPRVKGVGFQGDVITATAIVLEQDCHEARATTHLTKGLDVAILDESQMGQSEHQVDRMSRYQKEHLGMDVQFLNT